MHKKLLRHYHKVNLPGIAIFVGIYLLGKFNVDIFLTQDNTWLPPTLMVAAGLFAIVLPLWYRILFVNKMKAQKQTAKKRFLKFEKNFLTLASISIYILIAGYLMKLTMNYTPTNL